MLPSDRERFRETIAWRIASLLLFIGAMWFVHGIDALLPRGFSAAGPGVVPRTWIGFKGILIAPFIHGSWEHLIANSVPLLILGSLILLRGVAEFVFVIVVTTVTSGLGTWLFGEGGTQHVGASGVALGMLGFLLFRSAFDRRISSFVITLAVAAGYATMLASSLVPEEDISWTGHFFGFVGGFIAARLRYLREHRVDPRVHAAVHVLEFPTGRTRNH